MIILNRSKNWKHLSHNFRTSGSPRLELLGSKTLGLNVLELQFVTLANHDQNVLVFVLDLLKVCLYVKLELMFCRIYCVNLLGSIDRELDLIDRKSCKLFFCRIFQLSPSLFDV